jgi:RNA polymerase sigma factor (sigma-70 family)
MPDDAALLSDYLHCSQSAFAELVQRHMNLVYAAARRQVRDPHLAEDVAQAVFIVLSRRAASLRASPTIAGWLIKTTRYVSTNALRAQYRRQKHEQVAAMLASHINSEPRSEEITAILDDALSKLRPKDRSAIAMRFLQNRSVEEISTALQISPSAAAKRLERALTRLRDHLSRRGVVASGIALTSALAAESSIAAPPALTATAAAGTFTPVASSLAKGTLTAMLRTKLITAAALFIIFTGAGVTTHLLKVESPAIAAAPAPARVPSPAVAVSAPATAPTNALVMDNSDDGWRLKSDHPGDYKMGLAAEAYNGSPVALLASVVDHPQGEGARGRILPAVIYRGKRLTLAADLKYQDVAAVAGLTAVVVDIKGAILVDGDAADKHLFGNRAWARYTFTFDVPNDAMYIGLGMSLRGGGKLWGTNFQLYPVDKSVPTDDDSNWHIWTYTPAGFTWGKDPKVQRNGHPTWFIDATQSMPGEWAYFDSNRRNINDTLAGKRVRYSVWLKCENVIPPSGITFRTMGPGLGFSPRMGKPGLIGTIDWKKYEMVLDVNDRATWLCPGAKIQSSGKLWIDEPKIEVVEKSVPLKR